MSSNPHDHDPETHVHHHILSYESIATVGVILLILTGMTVWIAGIDLGPANFPVAFLIATIKGLLVAVIFMNLRYDRKENAAIFATSFLFLAIFIVLTSTDLFFRGDVYVKPGALLASGNAMKSHLKDPWITTPELISHGKELFLQNCTTCHGVSGQGNGMAAAGLNPKPRNFTQDLGWVNGRLPSQVFKTLKEGVAGSGMASFATLPVDDRWALAQYVLSLGPPHPQDTPETLVKIGFGPNGQAEEKELPTVPIDFALERMAQAESPPPAQPPVRIEEGPTLGAVAVTAQNAGEIYQSRCTQCHGAEGQGGIRIQGFGLFPRAYLTTQPFAQAPALHSAQSFEQIVRNGLPGKVMPGYGQLSSSELAGLYTYVRELAQKNPVPR